MPTRPIGSQLAGLVYLQFYSLLWNVPTPGMTSSQESETPFEHFQRSWPVIRKKFRIRLYPESHVGLAAAHRA